MSSTVAENNLNRCLRGLRYQQKYQQHRAVCSLGVYYATYVYRGTVVDSEWACHDPRAARLPISSEIACAL